VPTPDALDVSGLDLDADVVRELVTVDPASWRAELPQLEEHYRTIGERVPTELHEQLETLEKRLTES
jgi:phosphoenolpyruvate carboxykinase (GTP)